MPSLHLGSLDGCVFAQVQGMGRIDPGASFNTCKYNDGLRVYGHRSRGYFSSRCLVAIPQVLISPPMIELAKIFTQQPTKKVYTLTQRSGL